MTFWASRQGARRVEVFSPTGADVSRKPACPPLKAGRYRWCRTGKKNGVPAAPEPRVAN